jgi:hypothetical protein
VQTSKLRMRSDESASLRDKDPKASGTTTTSSTVSPETCSGAGSCGHSLQPPEHCLRSSTESKRRMAH